MGHVNDYYGFVQLHPAGINRVPHWQGVRKRDITEVHSAPSLKALCETSRPSVVFINEDCFIHHEDSNQLIRQIISQYPATLFVIFMSLANIHFNHYLLVRKTYLFALNL